METKLIYKAINGLLKDAPNISKGRQNKSQGYAFRGIDDFYDCFQPLFAKHELTLESEIKAFSQTDRPTKSGGVAIYTVIHVKWHIRAVDGSFISIDTLGEAQDSGDKSANKAMSASLKYMLTQLGLVSTGEDNDTENHSVEFSRGNPQAPKTINNPAGKITTTTKTAKQPEFNSFNSSGFGFNAFNEKDVP